MPHLASFVNKHQPMHSSLHVHVHEALLHSTPLESIPSYWYHPELIILHYTRIDHRHQLHYSIFVLISTRPPWPRVEWVLFEKCECPYACMLDDRLHSAPSPSSLIRRRNRNERWMSYLAYSPTRTTTDANVGKDINLCQPTLYIHAIHTMSARPAPQWSALSGSYPSGESSPDRRNPPPSQGIWWGSS